MSTPKKYTYAELLDMVKSTTYAAPEVWNDIVVELDLNEKISQLPEYKAPSNIWDNIEEALDEDSAVTESPTKKIKKKGSSKSWALLLAGVFLGMILLLIAQRMMNGDIKNSNSFTYNSEVELAELENTRIEIDDNIDEALRYIEDNSFMFDDDQLKEFNEQLNEINKALNQLIELQEKYGLDESSNKLMARMERNRATLLKEMIANT